MITTFKKYLIKESPDNINGDYYIGKDAYPFFIEVNNSHTEVEIIYIGEEGDYHADIDAYGRRHLRAYPGRLWLEGKIMSFWVYPNEILFLDIIKHLEKHFNVKILNNGWRIEVISNSNSDNNVNKADFSGRSSFYMGDNRYNQKVIPIEEYVGSENLPEELQIQHLMNWQEKELAKKVGKLHFKGFGSDKTAWDSPHNIKYRQAIYQEKKNN